MPVVLDDPPPVRPAVYPPAPVGTDPAAGGGATNYPPGYWVAGTPGDPGTPGYTPDYAALYHSSPEYQAWLASATGQNIGYANQRAAIIRELIRQYGGIPQAFADAFGDIRPEDIAAAQANQFSSEAGIQRNYELGVSAMRRALAARGVLQSGELDVGQSAQDLARGQAEGSAFTDFIGNVNRAVGDYMTGVQGVAQSEVPLIASTMATLRDLYPATAGTPGTEGTPGHWQSPPPVATAKPATQTPASVLGRNQAQATAKPGPPVMLTRAQWAAGPRRSGTYSAYVNWFRNRR